MRISASSSFEFFSMNVGILSIVDAQFILLTVIFELMLGLNPLFSGFYLCDAMSIPEQLSLCKSDSSAAPLLLLFIEPIFINWLFYCLSRDPIFCDNLFLSSGGLWI
jgi:hypothetical protein